MNIVKSITTNSSVSIEIVEIKGKHYAIYGNKMRIDYQAEHKSQDLEYWQKAKKVLYAENGMQPIVYKLQTAEQLLNGYIKLHFSNGDSRYAGHCFKIL